MGWSVCYHISNKWMNYSALVSEGTIQITIDIIFCRQWGQWMIWQNQKLVFLCIILWNHYFEWKTHGNWGNCDEVRKSSKLLLDRRSKCVFKRLMLEITHPSTMHLNIFLPTYIVEWILSRDCLKMHNS